MKIYTWATNKIGTDMNRKSYEGRVEREIKYRSGEARKKNLGGPI